ncbi:MAG: hypothetical protein LBO74_15390 [Candidatus Symbiothrix sp.]|jgi:DNA-binding ferritin-like protein|nr:hypothetical protein [Candidatus Symbiothrix sp.]
METKSTRVNQEIASFMGNLFFFNNSLKLFHWHVSGSGSYAQHIALDQAIASLLSITDRLVETSYATHPDMEIKIPETSLPSDIVVHSVDFYDYVETQRELFTAAFAQSIIDEYQEAIQQLLYRLKRLQ